MPGKINNIETVPARSPPHMRCTHLQQRERIIYRKTKLSCSAFRFAATPQPANTWRIKSYFAIIYFPKWVFRFLRKWQPVRKLILASEAIITYYCQNAMDIIKILTKILPALARRAGMWYSDNLVSVYQGIVSLAHRRQSGNKNTLPPLRAAVFIRQELRN